MPWEETETLVRSGHRRPEEFQKETLRTLTLSEEEGIKAIVGKPLGKHTMEVESYLFEKAKGWTVAKAKEWFEKHGKPAKEHVLAVLPFSITEKILEKPLRIRGVAMTSGMSRNFNIYTAEELEAFTEKLVGAPVYYEHINAEASVGKVTQAEWDGQRLLYEAEIHDEDASDKIRKGLIRHVSVGADYETLDLVVGKIPHGLHNAPFSALWQSLESRQPTFKYLILLKIVQAGTGGSRRTTTFLVLGDLALQLTRLALAVISRLLEF